MFGCWKGEIDVEETVLDGMATVDGLNRVRVGSRIVVIVVDYSRGGDDNEEEEQAFEG